MSSNGTPPGNIFKKVVLKCGTTFIMIRIRLRLQKKVWSHVKANSKNHRIPECMHRKDRYRSIPKEKCDLFNDYFFDQFSEVSNYGIPIDWSNDEAFDIEFSPSKNRKSTT
jgi:hypothetical protein